MCTLPSPSLYDILGGMRSWGVQSWDVSAAYLRQEQVGIHLASGDAAYERSCPPKPMVVPVPA